VTVLYLATDSSEAIAASVFRVVLLNVRRVELQGADKSVAQPTSRCILFDGANISLYIYSINISPIVIINRIYEYQNLLSL
jgi:hypothetical protein